MALRIEKRIGELLIAAVAIAGAAPLSSDAQQFSYQVRHVHLHGGEMGTLRVTEDSIAFETSGKHAGESREWKYAEIQQLSLSATRLRVLTYDDNKWQLGRDREYIFDQLPEDLARQLYPLFAPRLDQRFVAALAEPPSQPMWRVDAKLRHRLGGSQGTLMIADDRIVYQSETPGESRTWRFRDIDSINTSGVFNFSITTLEHSRWRHTADTEFVFELKEPLNESRYNELWRKINDFSTARN